jgi:O-succinylbenzoate synthase
MALHFQFRRYRLPLRTTVRTAHEVWTERAGLVLRLTDEAGRAGYGEVAPIPVFGTETVESAEAVCRAVGEWPSEAQVRSLPAPLHCVRSALAAALADLAAQHRAEAGSGSAAPLGEGTPPPALNSTPATGYRAVAALLPAGPAALAELPPKADAGFRIFKWKVGVGDPADELPVLDDLCAALPTGGKLRLDANGAWERRQAERWLERCAERPVEFVEQPCFAPKSMGDAAMRRADDVLLGLAHDFPTPLALDESLVAAGDVERWLAAGWPGWFVVKPSLLGDIDVALQRLAAAKATVVFSSALETAVGARAALRVAFSWTGEAKALGFGVWPLFADVRFDGPASAPFVRAEDVARINPEIVWNALS